MQNTKYKTWNILDGHYHQSCVRQYLNILFHIHSPSNSWYDAIVSFCKSFSFNNWVILLSSTSKAWPLLGCNCPQLMEYLYLLIKGYFLSSGFQEISCYGELMCFDTTWLTGSGRFMADTVRCGFRQNDWMELLTSGRCSKSLKGFTCYIADDIVWDMKLKDVGHLLLI